MRITLVFSPVQRQVLELGLELPERCTAQAALVGPVFDKIAGSLVDAFVKRADQVYGAD